jgi:hypothetical protein
MVVIVFIRLIIFLVSGINTPDYKGLNDKVAERCFPIYNTTSAKYMYLLHLRFPK